MIFRNSIFIILFLFSIDSSVFAALTCSEPQTKCVESNATRYVDEVAVTLDCWRYRTVYECREKSDNNCQTLRDKGCFQVSAKCRRSIAGQCVVQDEKFKCPTEQCSEDGNIICGKNKIFCIEGNCSPTVSSKSNSFDKALSSLAVLANAAKDVDLQDTQNPQIFVGKPMECSRNILPGITKDCCADNEGIFNCTDEERKLVKDVADGRAIEVGEYCYNKPVLGLCTSYHKAYCVFSSKIAKIVQNEGRKHQLGINFGYAGGDHASLNCRGVTKEELSKIDFSRIDFSPIYNKIKKEMSDKITSTDGIIAKATNADVGEVRKSSTKGLPIDKFKNEQKILDRMKGFYERANK